MEPIEVGKLDEIKTLIEDIDGDVAVVESKFDVIQTSIDALEDSSSGIIKTVERPNETFVTGATTATSFAEKNKCNWPRILKICYCSVWLYKLFNPNECVYRWKKTKL